jgi:hypothetical protein
VVHMVACPSLCVELMPVCGVPGLQGTYKYIKNFKTINFPKLQLKNVVVVHPQGDKGPSRPLNGWPMPIFINFYAILENSQPTNIDEFC